MKTLLHVLTVAVAGSTLAGTAHAIPQLRISDALTTLTIADGDAADTNAAAGALSWSGTIGVWTVTVNPALTKPALGFVDHPHLSLSFSATSSAAGTLTVFFTETDFNTGRTGWGTGHGHGYLKMDGSTTGMLTYSGYGGHGNDAFAVGSLFGTIGPVGPGAFAHTFSSGKPVAIGNFSLTQQITVTHDAAGTSSVNALLRVPESGTSLLLLGIGLVSVSLYSRARRGSPS